MKLLLSKTIILSMVSGLLIIGSADTFAIPIPSTTTINSINFSGAPSVTAGNNTPITLSANVSLNGMNWSATKITLINTANPASTFSYCVNLDPNITNDGTYSKDIIFTPNVPMATYNMNVVTHSAFNSGPSTCGGSTGTLKTITNAIVIGKSNQTITVNAITPKNYGDTFLVTASASSNLPVVLISNTPSVCSVLNLNITTLSAGTCSLVAHQSGNVDFNVAPTVLVDIVISRKQLMATATASDKNYDGSTNAIIAIVPIGVINSDDVTISATGSFSDKYVGINKVVSFSGITLGGTKALNYIAPASIADAQASINKLPIMVSAIPMKKELEQSDPILSYTVTPVLISGDSISGVLVRIPGETLDQYVITQGTFGTGVNEPQNYAITFVQNNFTIIKKTQTIAWTAVPDKNFGDSDFVVNASASSGLPVTFALQSGIFQACSLLAMDTIHITNLGQCHLVLTQIGDATWSPATPVNAMIDIKDLASPIITLIGADPMYLEVMVDMYSELGATATDNHFSGSPVVTVESNNVDVNINGHYGVVYKAVDDVPNIGRKTRSVIVRDTLAPVITVPASQTFEATGTLTSPTLISATALDLYDASPVITYSPTQFVVGMNTVTWTAVDASLNTSTATSMVIIADTTKPVIDTPAQSVITSDAFDKNGKVITYVSPASRDIVDGDIVSVCLPSSGSVFARGTTTVTCAKTDSANNTAIPVTFTVVITDTTIPVISLKGAASMNISYGSVFVDPGVIIVDTDEDDLVHTVSGAVNTLVPGVYTLTYAVSDKSKPIANVGLSITRTVKVDAVPMISNQSNGGGGGSIPDTIARIKELKSDIESAITSTDSDKKDIAKTKNTIVKKVVNKKKIPVIAIKKKKKNIAKIKPVPVVSPTLTTDTKRTIPTLVNDKNNMTPIVNTGTASVIDAFSGQNDTPAKKIGN